MVDAGAPQDRGAKRTALLEFRHQPSTTRRIVAASGNGSISGPLSELRRSDAASPGDPDEMPAQVATAKLSSRPRERSGG
jgi:hypothetical protein